MRRWFFQCSLKPLNSSGSLWALPFLLAIQLFQWSICGSVRRGERPWSALEDTQGCQGQYEDMPKTSLWYMVNINCWRWGGKLALVRLGTCHASGNILKCWFMIYFSHSSLGWPENSPLERRRYSSGVRLWCEHHVVKGPYCLVLMGQTAVWGGNIVLLGTPGASEYRSVTDHSQWAEKTEVSGAD